MFSLKSCCILCKCQEQYDGYFLTDLPKATSTLLDGYTNIGTSSCTVISSYRRCLKSAHDIELCFHRSISGV